MSTQRGTTLGCVFRDNDRLMPIETQQQLRDHIELAIEVELSTIPPYLFAMYSIEDQGSESALLIKSIVAEEMLHAVLASNLLLALGGRPRFDSPEILPVYPGLLPHHRPPLELSLAPCSRELIRDVLMRIEQPEVHGAPAQPDEFETLGQFYHALESALKTMSSQHDLFSDPQVECQLADPSFYAPVEYDAEDSGGLIQIDDLESALAAIEIIIHQGEGLSSERWADPAHQELTHYHKLLRIYEGKSRLGPVRSVRANPRTTDYPESLQVVSQLFNAGYRYVFHLLDVLFQPSEDKTPDVGRLYLMMKQFLSGLALFLVGQPLGNGEFAAPTFELFEFRSADRVSELAQLARTAYERHDELSWLEGAISGLRG